MMISIKVSLANLLVWIDNDYHSKTVLVGIPLMHYKKLTAQLNSMFSTQWSIDNTLQYKTNILVVNVFTSQTHETSQVIWLIANYPPEVCTYDA